MKSPIPSGMRGRVLSNIIVIASGIGMLAVLFYFDKIWGFISRVINTAMPFIIGFCIAFLLLPIVNKVEWFFSRTIFRKKAFPKLNRAMASLIAFIVLALLVGGFFRIMVPQLINSITSIVQYVAAFIRQNTGRINQLLLKYEFLNLEGEDLVIAWEKVASYLSNYSSLVFNNVMAISNSVYTLIFQLFVGIIAAFYLLMEKENFCTRFKKLCYAMLRRDTCDILIFWTRKAHRIFAGFITGKIIDSMIIGVICYIGMLIFKMEYAMLISVVVGITNVIPFFGPFIGAIPSILILLLVNPMQAVWFAVFILFLQQLDGNVIGPLILGDYVGVSAFWIMVSIVIGGGLFGFAGMLLSVPLFALVYAIVRAVAEVRLKRKNLPTDTAQYANAPESLPRSDEEPFEYEEASDI